MITRIALFKNGEQIFTIFEQQSSDSWTSSNGASLLLEVGDHVFLRLLAGASVRDSGGSHTIFSGHLLFTM